MTGWVEFTWFDDKARDWSITTWAQSGEVKVELTSDPDRPSDERIELTGAESVITQEDHEKAEQISEEDGKNQAVFNEEVIGEFVRNKPEDELNDWHYAKITVVDAATGVYRWTNRADVSWTLTADDPESPLKLAVGEECPYYEKGFKEATFKYDADGNVYAITGPSDKIFYLPYTETADSSPDLLVAEFVRNKPARKLGKWHYADISVIAKGVYRWANRAGVSWEVTKDPVSPDKLNVEPNCPYYDKGHREATLRFDADGNVYAIVGPDDKVFYKPYTEPADSLPDPLVAEFVRDKPAHKLRSHHYADISVIAKGVYRWTDRRGKSWELTKNP